MTHRMLSNHHIAAVIFDWAGTTVDYGSLAPVEAIRQLFVRYGVELTNDEIRKDMGLHKRDHIRCILSDDGVRGRWRRATRKPPSEEDVEALFDQMVELQIVVLAEHSRVISGVPETVEALRTRGIKIGSTTGYARDMTKQLVASAAAQGYSPDCVVCPEDVGQGRPFPWMIYSACTQIRAYPLWHCVKVGDTVSDMEEGRNAGTCTVGITRTGNLVGISEEAWSKLNGDEKKKLIESAAKKLKDAGADFVVESVAELPSILDQIDQQMERHTNK